ncbi:hypothetical protein KM043_010198 [Ampulex compressa]|nr:hypothetical protein KM043_010198 [Ampulex compressa]
MRETRRSKPLNEVRKMLESDRNESTEDTVTSVVADNPPTGQRLPLRRLQPDTELGLRNTRFREPQLNATSKVLGFSSSSGNIIALNHLLRLPVAHESGFVIEGKPPSLVTSYLSITGTTRIAIKGIGGTIIEN